MNATTANPEVRTYLEAVRAHLADLPEGDLEELLDDLEGHLLEVAAEDDDTLEERLGPPNLYAEELRATAGLPSRDSRKEPLSRRMFSSFERSALGRIIDTAWTSKTAVVTRSFLPELRPGWWVLRGYLVVWAAGILSYQGYYTNPFVPNLSSYALGIAVTVVAIVASVAIGRAGETQPSIRRFSLLASLGIIAASVAAVMNAGNVFAIQYVSEGSYPEYLSHAGGAPISNICPYSADGKLLPGVLLFDQDGRAIDAAELFALYGTQIRPTPIPPSQPQVTNAYPKDFTGVDPVSMGIEVPLSCPPTLTGMPANPGG